ncbi:hypothetical protein V8C42DRAFT_318362 [Trichoderma barbatum]
MFAKVAIPATCTRPILFNGHLRTMRILLDNPKLPIFYKRWIFQHQNNLFRGEFAVDFVIMDNHYTDDRPTPETMRFSQEEQRYRITRLKAYARCSAWGEWRV